MHTTLPRSPQFLTPVRRPSVPVQFAREIGVQAATAERMLGFTDRGLFVQIAKAIEVYRRNDAVAELEARMVLIHRAYGARPAPRPLAKVRHELKVADAAEECSHSLLTEVPSAASHHRWAADLRQQAALSLEAAEAADLEADRLDAARAAAV